MLLVERLTLQLARLRRMQFGSSSEKVAREIEQLELALEEIEAEAATAVIKPARAPLARPLRQPLPKHLPRDEVVHEPCCLCPDCGATMRRIGDDVTEQLDYVPASFRVIRHVRPKLGCRTCDRIVQAPLPTMPIERGKPGAGLLAHVLVAKYADHLPLYRQSDIYAREGVDLARSTLADWVGRSAALLEPLVDALARHVTGGSTLHADDTPVPVLAPGTGRTRTGRLWVYVRDERGHGGEAPPAALFRYAPDRKGERPVAHLGSFVGHVHADGYAGFNKLYGNRIAEVACMAHVRSPSSSTSTPPTGRRSHARPSSGLPPSTPSRTASAARLQIDAEPSARLVPGRSSRHCAPGSTPPCRSCRASPNKPF